MKTSRITIFTLACLALLGPAWADVRSLTPSQYLEPPPGQTFTQAARNVAIDGTFVIVLASHDAGQSALLYERVRGARAFTYRRTLLTFVYPRERMQVRMRNGLAVVHFGDRAWIFERVNNNYVLAQTAAPLRHPGGVAISAKSILIGGDNCTYDAVVYEKRADGIWDITGRIDDHQGQCHPEGRAVELHYDYALVQEPGDSCLKAWHRGTALDWMPGGFICANAYFGLVTRAGLQNATAVTAGSGVNLREGSDWRRVSYALPADFSSAGLAADVVYRDGVLLATHAWREPSNLKPYAFIETAPGFFEHVAILDTERNTIDFDVSGSTVVAAEQDSGGDQRIVVFTLPEPLVAPPPIPDDFEDRNAGDFTVVSGQFALATRGSDDVLTQTATSGVSVSVALANDSDWNDYQRIEADIAPRFGAADAWVGLVARYVDANNYYYVAVRNNNTLGIYRRLNGTDTLMGQGKSAGPFPSRVALIVDGQNIRVEINQQSAALTNDPYLVGGRAGLATFHAAADFDDVHVAATAPRPLVRSVYAPNNPGPGPYGAALDTVGGNWESFNGTVPNVLRQTDFNRTAFAFTGGQVRNQEIDVIMALNLASSETAAWVGVLGRYVNEGTNYNAILRKYGRVEIRKQVNGVATVLAAANLAVDFGVFHHVRFRLVEDQLQLFLDGAQVLSARDDEIHEGQFGVATHRASATWAQVYVTQP